MKMFFLDRRSIALALLAGAFVSVAPAHADGFVKNKVLGDASKIYTAPPEFQLVNTAPRLVDCTHPVETTTYSFNLPPAQAPINRIVQLGGGPSGAQSTASAPMWTRPGVAPASFGTNIPAGGIAVPNSLPKGTSTNGLHGKLFTDPIVVGKGAAPKRGQFIAQPKSTPAVLSYETGKSVAVSGDMRHIESLHGTMMDKGWHR